MVLVSSKELVDVAYKNHFAVGAFNVGETIFVKNILKAAEKLNSPVILQVYPLEYDLMGSDAISYILRMAMKATVPVAVRLDHGRDIFDVARAENGQQPWYYTPKAQHVADRVAYLYEQDHMGLSTWHDDKALNEVDREAGIHTAELMGGDNVNYKEDYLNTMTDLKHAVYNDVVGMLFSTVELRHAQIMLTYNSIDNSSTAFGFSVSWQEHNKDGRQEHSDHFIAY
jgi:hypothetical protein